MAFSAYSVWWLFVFISSANVMFFGKVCKVHFGSFWCFGEGDFMPILFLAGVDACFYRGGGWHLPTSRAHLACVRGGGGNACAHGYVSGEYTKKA